MTLKSRIDFSKVIPASRIRGEDEQETTELKEMLREASAYLESFRWCRAIKTAYIGIGIAGVVGVFLFRIEPAGPEVDEWVWVIVGDLPPAYITVEDAPNPACALDAYIGAMEEWVKAAKAGRAVVDLIPVSVPATRESAKQLESRLRFLDREILKPSQDDLRQGNPHGTSVPGSTGRR